MIVSSHDDGDARGIDLDKKLHKLHCRIGIEVAGGLVGKDERWAVEERPRYGDTLLLAARQLVRAFIALVDHIDLGKHLTDTLIHIDLLAPSCSLEDKLEVIVDRAVGEKLEILEYDSHTATEEGDIVGTELFEIIACDETRLAVKGEFGIESFQEARLAATDTTDDIDKLACLNLDIDITEDNVILLRHSGIMDLYDIAVLIDVGLRLCHILSVDFTFVEQIVVTIGIALVLRQSTCEIVISASIWSCAEEKVIGIVGIEHGVDDLFRRDADGTRGETLMDIGVVWGVYLGISVRDAPEREITECEFYRRAGLQWHADAQTIEVDAGDFALVIGLVALLLDDRGQDGDLGLGQR